MEGETNKQWIYVKRPEVRLPVPKSFHCGVWRI